MASVKKFKGCAIWYACYAQFTGRFDDKGGPIFERVQCTTKVTDRVTALQLALTYDEQNKKAGARMWHQMQAKAFSQQITALLGGSDTRPISVRIISTEWLELTAVDKSKSAKTKRNYTGIVEQFLTFLGPRTERPIYELTRSDIIDFRTSEMRNGKSVGTINKALGVIKRMLDLAKQRGAIADNPAAEAGTMLPRTSKTAQKRSYFTFAQFEHLLKVTKSRKGQPSGDSLHPEWHTFIMITGLTGGRQQEPAKLRWSQVDLNRAVLILSVSKKDASHLIPLHPMLAKHLRSIRPKGGSNDDFVMPHIATQIGQTLSKVFREIILPHIGIVQPYETIKLVPEKGKGRKLAKYSIHSLRHALSTWLNEIGASDATRRAIVGHDDSEVSLGYTHVELETARDALARVGQHS